jgi:hypothetical protein
MQILQFYHCTCAISRQDTRMSNATTLSAIIENAAQIIGEYNPQLANCFRTQPFRRVILAESFAAGFKKNEYGDAPEICHLILRAAYADRASRAVAA